MKPYFKVAWNMFKYNLIKTFRCNDMKIRGFILLSYNTRLSVQKSSHIVLGKNIISDGRCVIVADENARIDIGEGVYFNEGMMISSKSSVSIGSGCQFGPNVKIFDNNHCFDRVHGVLSKHSSSDIQIGRNCWIAANVTILKGAHIGDNCVIGAGCVVKGKIPSASIVPQRQELKVVPIEDKKL